MGLEAKAWDLIASAPGLAVGAIIAFWAFRALARRDDTIKEIAAQHTAAYVANQKVLEENSRAIGENSAVLRDCRDELRASRRRTPA